MCKCQNLLISQWVENLPLEILSVITCFVFFKYRKSWRLLILQIILEIIRMPSHSTANVYILLLVCIRRRASSIQVTSTILHLLHLLKTTRPIITIYGLEHLLNKKKFKCGTYDCTSPESSWVKCAKIGRFFFNFSLLPHF